MAAAKILVLGATGNIGSLVVKELLDRKLSVSVGVRGKLSERKGAAAATTKALTEQGVEIREFDFNEKDTWSKSLKGVESLFLLPPFQEKLAASGKGVIDAAKKAGVKHIVKISSRSADSKSSIHIAKEHGEIDNHLKASGVAYTILRPTFFTSNLVKQANSIATQGVFYGSAGSGSKTSYITPRDVARVAAHVLAAPEKHRNQVYPLSGAELLSSEDIASTLSLVLRKTVKYVELSAEEHKSSLLKAGAPTWQVEDIVGLEQFKQKSELDLGGEIIDSNVKKITGSWPQSFASWVQENKVAFTLAVPPLSDLAKKRAAGQIAVVTGANRGIGLSVVKELAKLGVRVILTARDEKSGSEEAAKLQKEGLDVQFHALDVSSETSVAQFKQYLEKEHKGKVDLLINNAAIAASLKVDFFGITTAEMAKVHDTNVLGSIRVLHAVADLIKTYNSGSGRIVNISSMAGQFSWQSGPGFAYTHSKLGLNAATQAAALAAQRDEKTKNLHIVALCPGPVDTDMFRAASVKAEDFGYSLHTVDQAADEIVSLALADNFANFHGKFFQYGKELSY